jgi:3-phenylpropionate/cinnamic acid dioxygenase small subunit
MIVMQRSKLVALAAAGLLASSIVAAQLAGASADNRQLQRLLDESDIAKVLVRYTHALDTLDADAYAGVFAEDAVFDMGREVRRGRAEIRDVIVGLQKSRAERQAAGTSTPSLMHHVMTNATLEIVDEREARHYAYWMTILGGADDKFTVASMGHYEDRLVKHGDRWLIQERQLLR